MRIALIPLPCEVTDWRLKGRLLGRVELEPRSGIEAQCAAWGDQLQSAMISKIFHAPDELSKTTAEHIGRRLDVATKALGGLVEVDLGLWAGLTEDELKKRYAKAYRQLLESPLNVAPPQGEDFATAADRLRGCLKKRIKPNGKGGIGLVMRPFAFAMARCVLGDAAPERIWEDSQHEDEPVVLDCPGVPEPVGKA